MKHKPNFPLQTHFVGVLLPDDITLTLEDCRRYMRARYGCKSGHATPIHVTLLPPFALPDAYTTETLLDALARDVSPGKLGFSARVNQFDAFGDRTLFARVEPDARWTLLRDAVYASVNRAVPGCLKKDRRHFTPHITVANRDIPPGAATDALSALNEIALAQTFPVDNLTVFVRDAGKWEAAASLEL